MGGWVGGWVGGGRVRRGRCDRTTPKHPPSTSSIKRMVSRPPCLRGWSVSPHPTDPHFVGRPLNSVLIGYLMEATQTVRGSGGCGGAPRPGLGPCLVQDRAQVHGYAPAGAPKKQSILSTYMAIYGQNMDIILVTEAAPDPSQDPTQIEIRLRVSSYSGCLQPNIHEC